MVFNKKFRLILLPVFLLIIIYMGSTVALSQSSTSTSSSPICCLVGVIGLIAIIAFIYLKNKSDTTVRQITKNLVESKDLAGIDPLVNQLNDNNANVRNDAAYSLQNYGIENIEPILASILKYRYYDIRATTSPKRPMDINVIVKNVPGELTYKVVTVDFAPDTINSLIPLINSSNKNMSDAVCKVFLEFNSVAVEPLIMLLNSPDKNMRVNSLNILGKIKDIRSVDYIMKALKDEDVDVRNAAAVAIKGFNIQSMSRDRETIREIVKMPCKYCGTLIEVTATRCPSCGAPFKP